MGLNLLKANSVDADVIFDIQVKAFLPLFEKYKDYDTNPANETIERVLTRINNPNGAIYKIIAHDQMVGAICVVWKGNKEFWISPMFIDPQHQGQGYAQMAIELVEKIHCEAVSWELATILEEERNCYLYEKMGYSQTGVSKKLNEQTTLIYYKKVIS